MPEEMTIEIYEDGKVQIHVQGTKGKKCEDIEKAISDAIGKIKKSDKTKEYYDQPVLTTNTVGH